jgi:hypothetical protein
MKKERNWPCLKIISFFFSFVRLVLSFLLNMVYVTIKTPLKISPLAHTLHQAQFSNLSFGDGAADLGTTLAGGETGLAGDKRALLDNLLALGEFVLYVAWVVIVWVDVGMLGGIF